jgi:predicted RNA-binding Zn-ribbon protein involved in translation (DUF1610 family)
MPSDYAESLLQTGIIEAKAGEINAARRYLERAIDLSGDPAVLAKAWYWLSKITEDPAQKRAALENCLSFDMRHAQARRALAILDGKLDASEIIDPDAASAISTGPKQATADRFMCPQCGAKMVFAPDGVSLMCEHCTRTQSLPAQGAAQEQDFLIAMATARGHRAPVAMQIFHCQGCGAEFILPPDVLSTTCAYCDSPYVIRLESSREMLSPEGIIPHAFDQKQASRLLADWLEQNGMKPLGKTGAPRGVYLPVWTFDLGGAIGYRGDQHEVDEGFRRSSQQIVHVEGEYPVHLDDLPVPASCKVASGLAHLLPTFALKAIRPYDPRYLADWAAEVYDVPMAEASLEARSQAYQWFKRKLPGEITALFNLKISSANLVVESFKLVLVPVWMAEMPFEGKKYLVLINGQNGVVQDDRLGRSTSKPKNGLFGWLDGLLDD